MFLSSSTSHTTVRAILKHTSEYVTSSLVTLPWLCIVFRRNAAPSLQASAAVLAHFSVICPLPSPLHSPSASGSSPTTRRSFPTSRALPMLFPLPVVPFLPFSPSYYFGIHCSLAPNTGHGDQEIFPNCFISRCLQSFNVFLTGPLGQKKSLTVLVN